MITFKRIIHDYNYWKESKDSEPIYMYIYIYIYTHTYTHTHTTEKYKRNVCHHQKNNSDVKTFKKLKNIKES